MRSADLDKKAAAAGKAALGQMVAWAARGESAPSLLLGPARGFVEWAHYPQPDSIDPRSGWRFYYHCHPERQRVAGEHGHFHIFVPPRHGAAGGPFSHLIGVSVDGKGLPLRLFTTNRWVTDETWQPAARLQRLLSAPKLGHAEPREVALWLERLLVLFRADIAALLVARDRRLADRGVALERRLDDHRLLIPSQRRINLARRLRSLAV